MIHGQKLGNCVLDSVPQQKWKDNYCLSFDGVNDYTKAPLVIFQQNDYTMETWIKDYDNQPPANNSQNLIWFTSYARFHILSNTSFVFLTTLTTGLSSNLTVAFPAGLNKNQWTHCVLRYTAATRLKEMFINGVLVGTQTLATLPKIVGGDWLLGIGGNFSFNPWKGKMSEFRFYFRTITNSEISYSYNGGVAQAPQNTTGLGYWYIFENKCQNLGYLGSDYSPQLYNFSPNPFLPHEDAIRSITD